MHISRIRGWRTLLLGVAAWLVAGLTHAPAAAPPSMTDAIAPQPAPASPAAHPSEPSRPGDLPTPAVKTEVPTLAIRPLPASRSTEAAGPSPGPGPNAEPSGAAADAPLRPIPEGGPAEIETASFNRVTPGASTPDDVQKNWGPPLQAKSQGGGLVHLYQVEPFDHVEVFFAQGKVASIVIRLSRSFPADSVAKQLALSNIRPVLVSSDLGEVLGQSYPERGVAFSFEPGPDKGKISFQVAQIVLEPVSAEPFLLRAETNLESQPESSLGDLDQALRLAPQNARAHWLKAKLLAQSGDAAKSLPSADASIRLAPQDAQYRVTRAQVLGQLARFPEAIAEAEQAIAASGQREHVKARAQCLVGDLYGSGTQPDFKRAIQYHTLAIKTATELKNDPHPAIRVAAKEVLLDAHLGAAHDVAWGSWNQKETAVKVWLERASAIADDLSEKEGAAAELRFRVAARALAACVGVQGKLDPGQWTEKVLQWGQELIAATASQPVRQQMQWETGMALYDAVQVYQMRGDHDLATKYGQRAIELLEAGRTSKNSAMDSYLIGRLYFRLGSIQAIGRQNHREAVAWFDKAVPVLQEVADRLPAMELGRLGETFVSMGVSYWETDQKPNAVKLTEQGVGLMEKAVAGNGMAGTALDVPYTNLATMHRQLGQDAMAQQYLQKAAAQKNGTLRR